ncbi:MAG: hypothetical protein H6744_06795 [Deltaproteobacteria bacterium]|nr:hypothetical protein [Deltaproteobacteria bacterium]MCB9786387.1 hypothetical protein [Deltaproteobacteria bacterium]
MSAVKASEPDGATRYATGAALMLLAAMAAAVLLAVAISGFYVPLLMPAIIGWGVGSAVAFVRVRTRVYDPLPAIAAAVLGATVAYAGYHLLCYVRLVGYLAEHLTTLVDRAAGDPRAAIQQYFEESTGRSGLWAYLQWVSEGRGAGRSPLGFFGALEPGLAGTLAAIAVESVVALGTALGFVVVRSGPLRLRGQYAGASPEGPRVREIIARTDHATLAAAMNALDAGDFEAAGRVLRNPTVEDTFAVAMVFNPYTAEAYTMEIHELTPAGLGTLRARRELSSWDGQALCDELRIQR